MKNFKCIHSKKLYVTFTTEIQSTHSQPAEARWKIGGVDSVIRATESRKEEVVYIKIKIGT